MIAEGSEHEGGAGFVVNRAEATAHVGQEVDEEVVETGGAHEFGIAEIRSEPVLFQIGIRLGGHVAGY